MLVKLNKEKFKQEVSSANIRTACLASGINPSTISRSIHDKQYMQEEKLKKFIGAVNCHEINGFRIERIKKLDYRDLIEE